MLRRTSLLGAIDTVRQWRDTLLSINRERNEECSKGGVTVIEDAIEKDREKFFYNKLIHLDPRLKIRQIKQIVIKKIKFFTNEKFYQTVLRIFSRQDWVDDF